MALEDIHSADCSFCVNCRLRQGTEDDRKVEFQTSASCSAGLCWRKSRLAEETTTTSTRSVKSEVFLPTALSETRNISRRSTRRMRILHSFCLFVFLLTPSTVLSSPLFSPSLSLPRSTPEPTVVTDDPWNFVPAKPMKSELPKETKPKWINPCGISSQHLQKLAHYDVTPLTDAELIENVVLAARNALRHSRFFKEDYVQNTFSSPNWWDHHETWKDMRYDWLPSWDDIPKHLHERPHLSHLEELKFGTTLKNIYGYLQRLAVGLEQVVLDQNVYDGQFMEEFNEAEFKLKAVLCELQVAMLEKGIVPEEDIPRSIMGQEVRDIEDESYRNLRDWYIYRDYMNGLEYVVHAFSHLKHDMKSPEKRSAHWKRRRSLRSKYFHI